MFLFQPMFIYFQLFSESESHTLLNIAKFFTYKTFNILNRNWFSAHLKFLSCSFGHGYYNPKENVQQKTNAESE